MSIVLKNEKFHILKLFGLAFGSVGVLVIGRFWEFSLSDAHAVGVAWMLVSSVAVAIGFNLQKLAIDSGVPTIAVIFWAFCAASLFTTLAALYDAVSFDFSNVNSWLFASVFCLFSFLFDNLRRFKRLIVVGGAAFGGIVSLSFTYTITLFAQQHTSPVSHDNFEFLKTVYFIFLNTDCRQFIHVHSTNRISITWCFGKVFHILSNVYYFLVFQFDSIDG